MTHADAVRTLAVERYLLEEMPEIERYAFEEHYFDCADCADGLRAGSAMRKAVKEGLLPDEAGRGTVPLAAPATAKRSWNPSVLVPWAAAAVLAMAVGYQALVPATRLPVQALTSVTLRPESRGALPTVRLEGDAVALTLDVYAPAGAELRYVLQTSSGDRVAEGKLSTSTAGAPLLLLVPVWTLTPSTQYSLAVQGATDGRTIGEYRFAVAAR